MSGLQPPTVLLVEDDPLQVRVAQHAIAAIPGGPTLVDAADGGAALAYLRGHPGDVNLVITDLLMPGMGGLGLLRAIKEDPVLSPVPVVVLTATPRHDEVEKAYASQAAMVLEKPERVDEMDRLIRRIVELYALVDGRAGARKRSA